MLIRKRIKDKLLVLIIIIMLLIVGFTPGHIEASFNTASHLNLPDEYKKVSESESLILYCNLETGTIAIIDKRNGYLWKSTIGPEDNFGFEKVGEVWKKSMSSLFAINYINMKKHDVIIEKAFSTTDADSIEVTYSNNKVVQEYIFDEIGIKLTIEVILEGDKLTVNIPADKIEENDVYGLITLELMPFFGASDRNIDGYILYPDGCGAIMKYEDVEKRPKDAKPYRAYIYSPEEVNITGLKRMKNNQEYRASLPIYGIKNGDNAFLAVIEKGEEETAIQVSPEGYAINLNWASLEFKYRHFYDMLLSNITVHGKDIAKKTISIKADKELILEDHKVFFMFLVDEDANYSGMANSYREYLINNKALKQAVKHDDKIPIALDIFMGIKEKRMIFDRFITMTSYEQASIIAEIFLDNGVKDLEINLKGWSKGGYENYPTNWPPERKLGGKLKMNEFLQYANEKNIKVFLQTNFIHALASNRGYSKKNNIAIQGNNLPVSDHEKNRFILNPYYAFNQLTNLIGNLNDFDYVGIALEDIGEFIYHDYNKKQPSSRSQTVAIWNDMLNASTESGRPLAVEGGNAYVLKFADRLFNIPINTSNYHINDETVPFYQMVVHGMIPYTSEPGNLFYDPQKQKLKWVEYGCMPYFELTYESAIQLKYTKYNKLFNSYYKHWVQYIIDVYKEFNQRLGGIWGKKMVEHERVNEKLVKVLYSNGTIIYINYDDKQIYHDGYLIEKHDYLVVEKGDEF